MTDTKNITIELEEESPWTEVDPDENSTFPPANKVILAVRPCEVVLKNGKTVKEFCFYAVRNSWFYVEVLNSRGQKETYPITKLIRWRLA